MSAFEVSSAEANRWWQRNTVTGVLLNRLMLLFIFGPMALVFFNWYRLSIVVFALMIPYGLVVRRLAIVAVRKFVQDHPEAKEEFENEGIITGVSAVES